MGDYRENASLAILGIIVIAIVIVVVIVVVVVVVIVIVREKGWMGTF
ncbi:hypothetical protein [Desulfatirhabdium butyrativorans]|nr:hypothetical protein [Desulfatirhabdium butyrativorans]